MVMVRRVRAMVVVVRKAERGRHWTKLWAKETRGIGSWKVSERRRSRLVVGREVRNEWMGWG